MKVKDFINALKNVAEHKTLYVMGGFGSPLFPANKARYTTNHEYNKQTTRTNKINAASSNTFAFDCCGLIKGVLWGWDGDTSKTYGGAIYNSNYIADISANQMARSWGISEDFSKIVEGAFVWMEGHIGVYIGDGLVIESSPRWKDGVQYTALGNIGAKEGYNSRTWTGWGKIPTIEYDSEPVDDIPEWAREVVDLCVSKGYLQGDGKGNLDLSTDLMRTLVILYRAGVLK